MGHRFLDILFSPAVKAVQESENSRMLFERFEKSDTRNAQLGDREIRFLRERDSFYMATVTPDGWPYLQHRGGPKGFLKVLDDQHVGFADFRGNRQYISTGNLRHNDRIALFLMDYPNRRRLKMLGRASEFDFRHSAPNEAIEGLRSVLGDLDYSADIERGFLIRVEAFDWNCSQHITPRFE